MLLAVNINNTQTKLGLYADDAGEDARPLYLWRLATDRARTADEWWVALATLLTSANVAPAQLTTVAIASVVPPVTGTWQGVSERYLHCTPLLADGSVPYGVRVLIDRPEEAGSDRVMNTLAAFRRYGGPTLVVDFGTATAFDCVSAEGDYLGSAIAPGLVVSFEALTGRAAQLSSVALRAPARAIGTGTVTALQSGVVLGHVAMVEGMARRLIAEMRGSPATLFKQGQRSEPLVNLEVGLHPVRVIATGGLASVIAPNTPIFDAVDDDLTLYGIYCFARLNMGGT